MSFESAKESNKSTGPEEGGQVFQAGIAAQRRRRSRRTTSSRADPFNRNSTTIAEETLPTSEECEPATQPLLTFEIPPPPPGEPPPLLLDSSPEINKQNSLALSTSKELIPTKNGEKLKVRTTVIEILLLIGPVFAGVGKLVLSGTFLHTLWLDPSNTEAKGLLRLMGVELLVISFLVYAICNTVVKTSEGRVIVAGALLGLLYCLFVFLVILWSIVDCGMLTLSTPLKFDPLRTGITLSAAVTLLVLAVLYNWYRTRNMDSLWTCICGVRHLLIRGSRHREKTSRAIHVIGIVYLTVGLVATLRQDLVLGNETFSQSCRGFTMYSLLVSLHGWLQLLAGSSNCLSFNKSCMAYRLVFCAPLFTILFLTVAPALKITVVTVQALNLLSMVVIWYYLMQDMKAM